MADTVKRLPLRLTEQDVSLDAHRFAYISDRTYTPDEVESMTSTVAETTPEHVKDAPNAKCSSGVCGIEQLCPHFFQLTRCISTQWLGKLR